MNISFAKCENLLRQKTFFKRREQCANNIFKAIYRIELFHTYLFLFTLKIFDFMLRLLKTEIGRRKLRVSLVSLVSFELLHLCFDKPKEYV